MIAALRDASSAYLHIYRAQSDFPVARLDAEHHAILAACVARDPERAAAATRAHLENTVEHVAAASMKRSTERILTTHVGRLPRPDDLIRTMFAKQEGVPVDAVALEERTRSAVAEVVARQVDAGVDVVSDGEMSKPSLRHLRHRPPRRLRRREPSAWRPTPTSSTSRCCKEGLR